MTTNKALNWVLDRARDFGDQKIFKGRLPERMNREIRGFVYSDGVTILNQAYGETWFTVNGLEGVEFSAHLPEGQGAESVIACYFAA